MPSTQPQSATHCSVNVKGNNNSIGSLTCTGIDANLANELKEIVDGTRKDERLLKDVSAKLRSIIDQMKAQPGTIVNAGNGSVISVNQAGGVTAGTINVTGPTPVKIEIAQISANEKEAQPDGSILYKTVIKVILNGVVPSFKIAVSAPSLVRLNFGPDNRMFMSMFWEVKDGNGAQSIDNDYGPNTLTIFSRNQERFNIQYQCIGATCVN